MMLELAAIAITMNVYMEARGEPVQCALLVAETVINRTEIKKAHAFDIVMANKQYSWTNNMQYKTVDGLLQLNGKVVKGLKAGTPDYHSYARSAKLAEVALANTPRTKYTHFHKVGITPDWSVGKRGYRCGNHLFYSNIAW